MKKKPARAIMERMSFWKRNIFLFLAVLALIASSQSAVAQTSSSAGAAVTCADAKSISSSDKAKLQAALDECNKQIAAQDQLLQSQQRQSVTYESTIQVLKTKITKAQLSIKAHDITISNLQGNIVEKSAMINDLAGQIQSEKDSIGQLLRKTNEIDQSSLVEVVLSKKNLSDFFLDIDSFNSIKSALRDSLTKIAQAKSLTETEKAALEEQQNKEADARAELDAQKRLVEKNKTEQNKLLSISKNKEKGLQTILAEQKKRAAAISAALFALRDTKGIQFGDALRYAQASSKKTGVDPAFLLAILQQETNLGKNQGSCYLKNSATGAGVGANTGTAFSRVMSPTRDVLPFMTITGELGIDPYHTLVSCPQSVGWGGAMGPAQFIPSTWMLIRDRVGSALGKGQTDPWDPQDAFMASAIYLADLGAGSSSYSAQRDAACRYFSGSKCSKSSFVASYGNSVMSRAANIQENMIDVIQGN